MIKRFLKIAFIISILSINIYSYANISVSDGSAFITKSEMSYQLNNLSNRMAQLENSLDAKIDSLVSSYLTRNGIWNGMKQTIDKTKILDFWNGSSSLNSLNPDFNSIVTTGTLAEGIEYKIRDGSWTLINNCNKAGLLFGKFSVYNGSDYAISQSFSVSDKRNFTFFQGGGISNNPMVSNTSEVSMWIDGVCKFSSIPSDMLVYRNMGTINSRLGTQTLEDRTASLGLVPSIGVFTPSFFVDKGDKVNVNYKLSFVPQTNDAKRTWEGRTFLNVGTAPGVAVVLDDFYIY